ncbi:hypothetical protein FXN61_43910 [Lentzea sp. PSKA42]|uniref:PEP-CTERM protein-sorting domain-containing protein n=1 Tax=Lentzea indica TaxID=2604800 RepID=A0ABX1FW86_9PSEU|nr:hypothetical protein [Lentzea indica]NKE63303.1 hypothetical protein [Lentzea indica]
MPRLLVPLVACVLVVALGVGAIMYADHDDAPGLGLIGVVLILGAIGFGARAVLRARKSV